MRASCKRLALSTTILNPVKLQMVAISFCFDTAMGKKTNDKGDLTVSELRYVMSGDAFTGKFIK